MSYSDQAEVASLPALIAHHAKHDPDRVYLIDITGSDRSYGKTHAAAQRWGGILREFDIEAGHTVLSMLPKSAIPVEVWMGIAWLRAIEVPVNLDYRGAMLQHVVNDSQARVMIVDSEYLDRLEKLDLAATSLEHVIVVGHIERDRLPDLTVHDADSLLATAVPLATDSEPEIWDIATILYTSGTTGLSKGVLVPWEQLRMTALGPWSSPSAEEVAYCPYPLFHVSGKFPLYQVALAGGRVVMRRRWKTESFWSDIRTYGCTTTLLMSATTEFVNRAPRRPDDRDNPLSHVVMAPVIPDVEDFQERFDLRVRTHFNMSEISPALCTGWSIEDAKSCGKAREGYQVRIVDENDMEVPVGAVGELVVRTDRPWRLMAGYWGRPEATSHAWRNLWLHTGDAFRRDEHGNYFYVDRMKDAIRRRGENISSFEVEREVLTHDDVAECAAIGVPAPGRDEEIKVFVVRKPDTSSTLQDIADFVAARAPRFMIPRYYELVDDLPRTPTGKIRKTVLRELAPTDALLDTAAMERSS
jgi:crotonobetaine/carnitine-CoA ligase